MQMLTAAPAVNLYHYDPPPVARYGQRDHAVSHSTATTSARHHHRSSANNSSTMQQPPPIIPQRAVTVDYYKNYRNGTFTHATASSSSNGISTTPALALSATVGEYADKARGQQQAHGQLNHHHQAAPTRNNSEAEYFMPAAAAVTVDSVSGVVGPSARRISAHQPRQESRRRSTSGTPRSSSSVLRPAKSETNLRPNTVQRSRSAMLSDQELFQIQLMYSGRATRVVVCSCLANLYLADARIKGSSGDAKAPSRASDWQLVSTGVPVLLLDCGETRTRAFRRLVLILAEKGTGFALWKDQIDSLTKYTEIGKSFHTMLLSTNHQRMAGFSFDSAYSSMQFYQQVTELCSNPENVALCPPMPTREEKKSRRHSFNGGVKKTLLRKSEISYPCCFNHVTSLKPHQLADDCAPKRAQSCIQIDENKLPSPTRSY